MYKEWNWEINIFTNILYDPLLEQADGEVDIFSSKKTTSNKTFTCFDNTFENAL